MFLGKNMASICEWQKVCASKAGGREREEERVRVCLDRHCVT